METLYDDIMGAISGKQYRLKVNPEAPILQFDKITIQYDGPWNAYLEGTQMSGQNQGQPVQIRLADLNALERISSEDNQATLGTRDLKDSDRIPILKAQSRDAAFCDVCGYDVVRNGTFYKCLNCGNAR